MIILPFKVTDDHVSIGEFRLRFMARFWIAINVGAEFRLLIGLIKPGQRKWGTLVWKNIELDCSECHTLFPRSNAVGERVGAHCSCNGRVWGG
jgi:hypothetical protein